MPTYVDTSDRWMDGVEQRFREINTKLGSIPSDATAAPWVAAASLGSGWTDLNATDATVDPVGFQVLPGRLVRMRGGVIRSGSAWPAAGFTLLTLPATLLPSVKQHFMSGSPFGNGWVFGEVQSGGAVKIWGWGGGTTGNAGTAITLDPLTYRLA